MKEETKQLIKSHFIPANQFMQIMKSVADNLRFEWDQTIDGAFFDEETEMEVCSHWIVANESLRDLMIECGCQLIQLEEVWVWCNTCSELFGSLAISTVTDLIEQGVYDNQFRKVRKHG
jgi:hypothetical protein